MDKDDKKKYYKTKAFKELRERCLERDGYECSVCGRKQEDGYSLTAHHKSYRYFEEGGDNELSDLITLCTYCHRAVHLYKPNYSWFSMKNPRNEKK